MIGLHSKTDAPRPSDSSTIAWLLKMCYTPAINYKLLFTFIIPMEQTKTKKAAPRKPRAIKAANSPEPVSSPADVSSRSVRYCGPTSHISHHHAAVAADGTKHIWAAPIIAGLAIILTATIAYSAVQAESSQLNTIKETELRGDYVKGIRDINQRLDQLEQTVNSLKGTAATQ